MRKDIDEIADGALPKVMVLESAAATFGLVFTGLIALLLGLICIAAYLRYRRKREGIYEKYRLREDRRGRTAGRRRAGVR